MGLTHIFFWWLKYIQKRIKNQRFSLQEHYHDQAEVLLTFVGSPNLLQRCQGARVCRYPLGTLEIAACLLRIYIKMSRHCGGGSSWIFYCRVRFSIEVMAAMMLSCFGCSNGCFRFGGSERANGCHNGTAVRGGWISFEEWSGHSEPGACKGSSKNPKAIWFPSQNWQVNLEHNLNF